MRMAAAGAGFAATGITATAVAFWTAGFALCVVVANGAGAAFFVTWGERAGDAVRSLFGAAPINAHAPRMRTASPRCLAIDLISTPFRRVKGTAGPTSSNLVGVRGMGLAKN